MTKTAILWFKRDLRVADNAALAEAARADRVIPIYIAEPGLWRQPDASGRQWAFVAECLGELRAALGRRGAPLVVRVGDAVAELEALRAAHGVTRLVSHEETGNGWTFARDRRVAAWAAAHGVDWREMPQSAVVRRLKGRDGWSARRERLMRAPVVPAPSALTPVPGIEPGGLPSPGDLGLAPDACPGRQEGGRKAGLALLDSFLAERGRSYRKDMSTPIAGERACSRLSPHFAWGTLSVREAAQATQRRAAAAKSGKDGWSGSLSSFASRLAWRDHFIQKLEDAPAIETRCLHSAYENLRPRAPDAARLAAWERGETGFPFADACMRYLAHGGWLNFRMRSMLMSLASYHLWLDWRATGPHLARMFTDYEPGIHWPQVQMQSGTTGMNTIRIYNPVKQGRDQDPTGVFTRRWVPELGDVPDAHLHAPWDWDGAPRLLGRKYPEPIVDVAHAGKVAREKVWAVRKGAGFRDEAARLVKRHASRKEPGVPSRYRRDRNTAPDDRQLRLDL